MSGERAHLHCAARCELVNRTRIGEVRRGREFFAAWCRSRRGARIEDAPLTWVDSRGVTHKTPTVRGRLKSTSHRALLEFVRERDGRTCRYCGAANASEVDHIISRRNGGSHHPMNLQLLCLPCNARKVGVFDVPIGGSR